MPILTDLCDSTPALCCEWLVDEGYSIMETVRDALYGCLDFDPDTDDCAPPFITFLGFGPPAVAFHDYLTVWFDGMAPAPATDSIASQRLLPLSHQIAWTVRFSIGGYPTFSQAGQEISNPDPTLLDRANQVMTSIAAQVMLTLGSIQLGGCNDRLRIESFAPAVGGENVLGGAVGFQVRISYRKVIA